MAAEAEFRDLVGESDSEDENFLGFTEGDIVDGDSDSGDELSITIEFDGDVNKPNLNAAYHSPWLRDFTEATGPRNFSPLICQWQGLGEVTPGSSKQRVNKLVPFFCEQISSTVNLFVYCLQV